MMDIRAYMRQSSSEDSQIKKHSKKESDVLVDRRKQCKRLISDSDSDEEAERVRKRKLLTNAKRVIKVFESSDSDESSKEPPKKKKVAERKPLPHTSRQMVYVSPDSDESPKKLQKKKKLERKPTPETDHSKVYLSPDLDESPKVSKKKNTDERKIVKPKSKFKETTASDVFGEEPVQRSFSKFEQTKQKINKNIKNKSKKETRLGEDEDFEAAMLQLDEVGDNWISPTVSNISRDTNYDSKYVTKISVGEHSEPSLSSGYGSYSADESLPNSFSSQAESSLSIASSFESSEAKRRKIKSTSEKASDKGVANTALDSRSYVESPNAKRKKPFSPNKEIVGHSADSRVDLSKSISKKFKSPKKTSDASERIRSPDPKIDKTSSSKREAAGHESNLKPHIESPKPKRKKLISPAKKSPHKDVTGRVSDSRLEAVTGGPVNSSLWVEKHKPMSSNKIIGQQGEKSNVKKLTTWLTNWFRNCGFKKKQSGFTDKTTSFHNAALLSGPPGVGKTTTVNLVCKELGFDIVEFNASDTRSKKLLQDEVAQLLSNKSLTPYFTTSNDKSKGDNVTTRKVLVMDEVDGMAGNEDRGGVQELIQLIKNTKVPIICMCNDRHHPKIRSLVNHCYDLPFHRPRVEQIKGFMKSICFKEKLDISVELLTDIITSSNSDIRLVLNHLSMLAADKNSTDLQTSKKYVKLGPWDVLKKVFSSEEHNKMTIHDKCALFFYDYSIAPLFVQENYLVVRPHSCLPEQKRKKMELFAKAADSISMGDLVEKQIRSNNAWSLLPTQAVFASYAPGEYLRGHIGSMINFPSWLGKNSKKNRMDRMLQEIQIHTRLRVSGSKESILLDYGQHLRNKVIQPVIDKGTDGITEALENLNHYQLLKEDLDSLNEICQWPICDDPMASISSKVKSAFTRAYNKDPPIRPYSLTTTIKKVSASPVLDETEDVDEDEDETDDDDADAMIVKKKLTAKQSSADVQSTSKQRQKGEQKKGRRK